MTSGGPGRRRGRVSGTRRRRGLGPRDLAVAARRALAAARLEAYRTLRDRRAAAGPDGEEKRPGGRGLTAAPAALDAGGEVTAEVIAYFADPPENLYQLRQWLPILARLDERHPVSIVTRSAVTAEAVERETELPVALVRPFRELQPFYERAGAKLCLYVNNHALNFQSLTFPDQVHVHLNHGESDKISMASNQARAYDHVLVAGEVAAERYRLNLLRPETVDLVEVGRPQLDLLPPRRAGGGRTALYAPTWEGGRDEMSYSSLATMGEGIIEALLAAGWRVVYRPHPKVGMDDEAAAAAHNRIVRRLEQAPVANDGLRHRLSGMAPGAGQAGAVEPIGEAFAEADVVIADVSSVIADALATGRPVVVTRPAEGRGRLIDTKVRSDTVAYPLAPEQLPHLGEMLERILADDPLRGARADAVARLFGDITPGASTRRFLAAIDAIVEERDRRLAAKHARLAARGAASPAGSNPGGRPARSAPGGTESEGT